MAIRTDLKDFPFEFNGGKVWYLFVDKDLEEHCFTASGSGKTDLCEMIKADQKAKRPFKVYGVWTGMYKTDLFVIPPETVLEKLK
jgi:hypothetical protein